MKKGSQWNESEILMKMFDTGDGGMTAEEIAKEFFPREAFDDWEKEKKAKKEAGMKYPQGGPVAAIRSVYKTGNGGWASKNAATDPKYAEFRKFLDDLGHPKLDENGKGFPFEKGDARGMYKPVELPADFKGIDLFGSSALKVHAAKSAAFGAHGDKGVMKAQITLDEFFDTKHGKKGYKVNIPKGMKKLFSDNDKISFTIESSTIPLDTSEDELKKSGGRLKFADPSFDKTFRNYLEHQKIKKTEQTQVVKEGRAMEAAVFDYINKMTDDVQEDGRRWDFTKANTVTMQGLANFVGLSGKDYERIDAKRTTNSHGVKVSLARKYIEGTQAGHDQLAAQMKAYSGNDKNVVTKLMEVMTGKMVSEQHMEEALAADFQKKRSQRGTKSFGGFVPNFATKILDKDQLAEAMGLPLGNREVKKVFEAIVNQAAQRGQISETIVGTAGIGKPPEAIKRAGGKNFITDPTSLDPSDSLVVVRAAHTVVDSPEFSKAGKITFLKGAREVVQGMREKRSAEIKAGTSDTGFGRDAGQKFGSTSGVVTEAILADKYQSLIHI